jgi:phosphoribosylformylglycinamidine cyclo-ligase
LPGLKSTVGSELLREHINYQPSLAKVDPRKLHGLAHVTGGGLIDNLPRVLPSNCDAVIETKRWRIPPIFHLLQVHGQIGREEMFQVFNMGIGMVAVVAARDATEIARKLKATPIGHIARGRGKTRLVF